MCTHEHRVFARFEPDEVAFINLLAVDIDSATAAATGRPILHGRRLIEFEYSIEIER